MFRHMTGRVEKRGVRARNHLCEAGPMSPQVEFLWWEDCPSWQRALEMLRAEARRAGLDPDAIDVIEIKSEDDAARRGFPGSPTIRVDGRDIDPAGASARPALNCRIYHLPDGRVSPVPTREQLEEALR